MPDMHRPCAIVASVALATGCMNCIGGAQTRPSDAGSDAGDAGRTHAGPWDSGTCIPDGLVSDLSVSITYTKNAYGSLQSTDLNGDGLLDLLAVTWTDDGGGLDVFYGMPDGGLTGPTRYGETFDFAVAAGDLNGDGRPDVVLGHGPQIAVLLTNADGTLGAPARYPVSVVSQLGGITRIAIGDMNGDGWPDVVVGGIYVPAQLFLGLGGGHLGPAREINSVLTYDFIPMVVSDLNQDGLADIAFSGDQRILVSISQSDGGFAFTGYSETGQYQIGSILLLPRGPSLPPDLIASFLDGVVALFPNAGDGSLQPAHLFQTTMTSSFEEYQTLQLGDFNGDGNIDAVTAGFSSCDATNRWQIGVTFGDGDGGFQNQHLLAAGGSSPTALATLGPTCHPRALAIADFCDGGIIVIGDPSRH